MKTIIIVLCTYFLLGGIVFNHLFPPSSPDFAAFLEQNRHFGSTLEGFKQEIKKVENDWAHCRVEMAPFAPGPPEHIHETFDEIFTAEKGTASILINGEKKTLRAGETLLIPKGTPHKPFNETGEVVVLNDTSGLQATMPARFAHGLACLYPVMDQAGDVNSPKIMLQLAAQGNDFDTWVSEAPIPAQKLIRWLLGPTARLLGYGNKS
jgi:mannose-6-phosphate isomerase-like protein (cupin superfamily)